LPTSGDLADRFHSSATAPTSAIAANENHWIA
jgi:hypothetical protein